MIPTAIPKLICVDEPWKQWFNQFTETRHLITHCPCQRLKPTPSRITPVTPLIIMVTTRMTLRIRCLSGFYCLCSRR